MSRFKPVTKQAYVREATSRHGQSHSQKVMGIPYLRTTLWYSYSAEYSNSLSQYEFYSLREFKKKEKVNHTRAGAIDIRDLAHIAEVSEIKRTKNPTKSIK